MENKTKTEYPRSVFAIAHTDIGSMPFNNHGRTLRLVVENNVEAGAIQVRFSNRHGEAPLPVGAASLALCDKNGVLMPDTLVPVTVGGVLSFEVAPGSHLFSDVIPFTLLPGQQFALNLYYPTAQRVTSGNWTGQTALRSRPGNFSADLQFSAPRIVSRLARTVVTADITVTTTTVSQIIAFSPRPGRVVGCFGDSITQQSNWTLPFERLLHKKFPGQVSLCNLGISGNRLLGGSPPALGGLNGIAGVQRFEEDLLSLPGLTHAIIALGTNDLGLPGSNGLAEDVLITPAQYAAAMERLAARLHENKVKVYATTLTPRAFVRPWDEAREALRLSINRWIRTAACFDAVIDFDAALRREDGKHGMQEGCALPDGLHPSPFGGILMAKHIDLSLFGGDDDG